MTITRKFLFIYFLLAGLSVHIIGLSVYVLAPATVKEKPFSELVKKANQRWINNHPAFMKAANRTLNLLGVPTSRQVAETVLPTFPGPDQWPVHGTIPLGLTAQTYGLKGNPEESTPGAFTPPTTGRRVSVANVKKLLAALKSARAGDVIELQPGSYRLTGPSVSLGGSGLSNAPIYVRAARFGEVIIELNTREGFYVDRPYWIFENLDIKGVCRSHSRCEHAFHVVGKAHGTVIRNNRLVDFNAALKVNGIPENGNFIFPDYGLVQNNTIFNSKVRDTRNPVTPLNVNGGNNWVVRANFIADFSKKRSNRVSYAAYMKGNSRNGVFERNLVVCHWQLPRRRDIRLGLSFGGGGTAAKFCRERNCNTEHTGGIMRNNIIARCPADVGIYLNRAAETHIYNNLLIATRGIDVRFETSSANIYNNVLSGRIKERDGGLSFAKNNLISPACSFLMSWQGDCSMKDWYIAPSAGAFELAAGDRILDKGIGVEDLVDDFCGHPRGTKPDLGPIEYEPTASCLPQSQYPPGT